MKKIFIWVLRILSPFYGRVKFARMMGVEVGNGCRIYINSCGSEPFLIKIGNNVTLTKGVVLLTHDGSTCLVSHRGERYQHYAPVYIGDNVFIGVNSLVMPGVEVCSNVVIGAGSVVVKSIMEPGIYVGNPVRKISSFEEFSEKIKRNYYTDSMVGGGGYKEKVHRHIDKRLRNEK